MSEQSVGAFGRQNLEGEKCEAATRFWEVPNLRNVPFATTESRQRPARATRRSTFDL